MKCAVAVMSRSRGRRLVRSRRTVNHAGTLGFRNETTTELAVRDRRCAFLIGVPQIGAGCGRRVLEDRVHEPLTRSQRLVPMTIPVEPPRIRYSTRSGASSMNRETMRLVGLEASLST